MTTCEIFVGDLNSPGFKWEGGDWTYNLPASLTEANFDLTGASYNMSFHKWTADAGVEVRQVDFGGWVARVTKAQILDYIAKASADLSDLPHIVERVARFKKEVEALDPDLTYGLVATEF